MSDNKTLQTPKKTVVVGITGKLDSVMAAYLLKKQGYNCIAVSVMLSDYNKEKDGPLKTDPLYGSCYIREMDQVKNICYAIKIPFYAVDATQRHRYYVTDQAIENRLNGRPFDPLIYCNYLIMDILLEKMQALKADYIASGHYAKISHNYKYGKHFLMMAEDENQDQTYDLCRLTQKHLSKLLLPLSSVRYKEVQQMATSLNISFIEKSSSHQTLFPQHPHFSLFIKARVSKQLFKKGSIYNYFNDLLLADHTGIHQYYLGQKNLPEKNNISFDPNLEIISIDPLSGSIYVNMDIPIESTHCYLTNFNLSANLDISKPSSVYLKISRHSEIIPATAYFKNNNTVLLEFKEKYTSFIPTGQPIVLYNIKKKGKVLGGGITLHSGIFTKKSYTHLPKKKDQQEDTTEEQDENDSWRF